MQTLISHASAGSPATAIAFAARIWVVPFPANSCRSLLPISTGHGRVNLEPRFRLLSRLALLNRLNPARGRVAPVMVRHGLSDPAVPTAPPPPKPRRLAAG